MSAEVELLREAAAEPICCDTPMVHNSFTEQYECADAYFALHDDGIDPYMVDADMTGLTAAQRDYLTHWMASRIDDATVAVRSADPLCTCTIDPDGARNTDGCVLHDLPPCGFLVDEVAQ